MASPITTRSRGHSMMASPGNSDDPVNRAAAVHSDKPAWLAFESAEIANHKANGSWTHVSRSSLPTGRRIVRFTWVYKVTRDGRTKSRLCVQGCSQVLGVDFDQTYCPAMRGGWLRLFSAVASRSKLQMRRWDFVAAYFQGELIDDEVVY